MVLPDLARKIQVFVHVLLGLGIGLRDLGERVVGDSERAVGSSGIGELVHLGGDIKVHPNYGSAQIRTADIPIDEIILLVNDGILVQDPFVLHFAERFEDARLFRRSQRPRTSYRGDALHCTLVSDQGGGANWVGVFVQVLLLTDACQSLFAVVLRVIVMVQMGTDDPETGVDVGLIEAVRFLPQGFETFRRMVALP